MKAAVSNAGSFQYGMGPNQIEHEHHENVQNGNKGEEFMVNNINKVRLKDGVIVEFRRTIINQAVCACSEQCVYKK